MVVELADVNDPHGTSTSFDQRLPVFRGTPRSLPLSIRNTPRSDQVFDVSVSALSKLQEQFIEPLSNLIPFGALIS